MKDGFAGHWENLSTRSDRDSDAKFLEAHMQSLSLSKVYLQSTTIIWNAGGKVIPLDASNFKTDKTLLLLTPAMEAVNRAVDSGDGSLIGPNDIKNTAGASYLALARAIENRAKLNHIVYSGGDTVLPDVVNSVGGLIFVMRNTNLKRWQLDYLMQLHRKIKEMQINIPVVLLSSFGQVAGRMTWLEWTEKGMRDGPHT